MTDQQLYLFDLQGYLAVPDALTADQLTALNALVDARLAADVPADAVSHRFGNPLSWGQATLDVLDNPRILPVLHALLGSQPRLDHDYLDVIRQGRGPIGSMLHGGGTPYDPSQYFQFIGGQMRNGLTVVAYNLHDVNPGDGGFGCVPGSHKSNYPFPNEWRDLGEAREIVRAVTGKAGTAIIFTEALAHGTMPWRGAHERRTLFYKYCPHPLSWARDYYRAEDYPAATPVQKDLLLPPSSRHGKRKDY